MQISPIAKELNDIINQTSPQIFSMLSELGQKLYFPKGIVSQSLEAKNKAHRFNATIGIATEKKDPMHLPLVRQLIDKSIENKDIFPYASAYGILGLRQSWKEKILRQHPELRSEEISTPVVTNAITHGLSLSGSLFLNPGDHVLVPDKFWGNYRLMWEIDKGAQLSTFTTFNKELTGLDLESFRQSIENLRGKKIFLVLNFPNNPTGYSPTSQERAQIASILQTEAAQGSHFVVVIDDAYFGMVYEKDIPSGSIFAELSKLHENILAVKIDGCTKEAFMWGFRLGFLTFGSKGMDIKAYEALEVKVASAIRAQVSNVSHPGQSILLQTLSHPDFIKQQQEKVAILHKRFAKVKACLSSSKYKDLWDCYPFNSGYFMCIRLKRGTAEELRLKLLDHFGIGVIASGEKDIRIAFSSLEEDEVPLLFEGLAQAIMG